MKAKKELTIITRKEYETRIVENSCLFGLFKWEVVKSRKLLGTDLFITSGDEKIRSVYLDEERIKL